MIVIENLEQLSIEIKNLENDLILKFDDVMTLYPIVSDIMVVIRRELNRFDSAVFVINRNSKEDQYLYIESVIHRYMRASFYDSYEICFINEKR